MTSSRVAIVGGYGKISRRLVPLLVERGDVVVPLVRRAEQAAVLLDLGAKPRFLDIERGGVDDFAAAFEGVDTVVFAAGGGPDGNALRKRTVDLEGSIKSAEAAARLGISRFVQVSAIGVDEKISLDMGAVWASYVVAKRDADEALRESGLDWTIVRPGRLLDSPGTGLVELADDLSGLRTESEAWSDVPRDDVAAVLAEVLATPGSARRQWDLIGGATPVAEAVARAVATVS